MGIFADSRPPFGKLFDCFKCMHQHKTRKCSGASDDGPIGGTSFPFSNPLDGLTPKRTGRSIVFISGGQGWHGYELDNSSMHAIIQERTVDVRLEKRNETMDERRW